MTAFTVQTAAPLHLQIADHIERRIVTGELHDGARLPNTVELAMEYGVTPVTIQKSLQRLVSFDLIERVPRRGTIVKPHQTANQIGVVFGISPFLSHSTVYLRLIALFRETAFEFGLHLKFYCDLYAKESSGALYELHRDVAEKRLKALIAIAGTDALMDWLREQREIFWLEPPVVNYQHSIKTGLKYLVERGYRRIQVVSMFPVDLVYEDFQTGFAAEEAGCQDVAAEYNVDISLVRWGQTEVDGYREGKILCQNSNDLPEAIFVHHDIVTRGFLLAAIESGMKIPSDIALLTHANVGCEFASPLPLTKVIVDPSEMVIPSLRILINPSTLVPGNHPTLPPLKANLFPGKSCGE